MNKWKFFFLFGCIGLVIFCGADCYGTYDSVCIELIFLPSCVISRTELDFADKARLGGDCILSDPGASCSFHLSCNIFKPPCTVSARLSTVGCELKQFERGSVRAGFELHVHMAGSSHDIMLA